MQNEIYLRRKQKLIVRPKNGKNSRKYLATALKNISVLGYTFDKKIIDTLKTYPLNELEAFVTSTVKTLKKMVGANVRYKPMYPNFPTQVMGMDEAELYINAIIHYITLDLPEYEKEKRPKLKDDLNLKVIRLGTREDFLGVFANIIGAKVAISPQDKTDVEWFVKQHRDEIVGFLPDKLENKENLSYLIGLLKAYNLISDTLLSKYFKTATDVLRFITALSDGDVSLTENTEFRNFGRSDRKLMLRMLENCSNIAEDMLRNKNRWIRVGEILHPFDYKKRFVKTCSAFDAIRNNKPIKTFNNEFNRLLTSEDSTGLIRLVKTRPGEFARRLDWILRTLSTRNTSTLRAFEDVAEKVSTTVLLQVREYFKARNDHEFRIFMPKGSVSKIRLEDNNLKPIKEESCGKVVKICEKALIKNFAKKEPLGTVYVSKDLVDYTVPFALRSASKSLRTVSRGSKIQLEKGNTIRMFINWKNMKKETNSSHEDRWYDNNRVDIDLSGVFYKENWEYMEHVSYTNLRSEGYNACHSGDITDAPKGASEFIDVDIESALKHGARYLVMNVIVYTEQPFSEVPECYAGCMMRQKPKSGEMYDPATVKDKFDLTSETRFTVPLIFDLKTSKIIWVDSAVNCNDGYDGYGYGGNNIENNQTGMVALGKAFTHLTKPNLYDLFMLHVKARGTLVSKSKAKVVFSQEEGITPFDIEKIASEYL